MIRFLIYSLNYITKTKLFALPTLDWKNAFC